MKPSYTSCFVGWIVSGIDKMESKTRLTILRVVLAILIPNVGGIIGAFFVTKANTEWYKKLHQPALQLPDWVFGPVWAALNTAVGVASYLVWRDGEGFKGKAQFPLVMYGIQLILNWIWTPIFFGMHDIVGALMDMSALITIAVNVALLFYKINRISAYLYIPYLSWLSLATYLTHSLYKLNSDVKTP